MSEREKKRIPHINRPKSSGKTERDPKLHQDNGHKISNVKENDSRASYVEPDSSIVVSDSNVVREPSRVYENMVIQYVDDVNRLEEMPSKTNAMGKNGALDYQFIDLEKEPIQGKDEESDCETIGDSVSSQGDSLIAEDEKVDGASIEAKSLSRKKSSEKNPRRSGVKSDSQANKSRPNASQNTPKKSTKTSKLPSRVVVPNSSGSDFKNMKVTPLPLSLSESSDGVNDKTIEEVKEMNVLDEYANGTQCVGSDGETVKAEVNGEREDEAAMDQKIGEMELRIEKLEEELREVAALEISIYSIVPEHGSSAHKVHTAARRLSRLYIHAGKHWTQDKRATIAKSTVSGLVLVAKSCGNDVPRLTFWLSNIIVLREIISQAFGSSRQSTPVTRFSEPNCVGKLGEPKSSSRKWKGGFGSTINGFVQFVGDWQEAGTLAAALEKVESWIFSRIVESVWWQALTPYMQSPTVDKSIGRTNSRLSGPALGDQEQGIFSVNLWRNAFKDAFQLLCPVRAGGHECGCLPVLARMVMEQCISRLDVAMFNAILRESAHEIPTDPVSDPILDSRVLPIPAGNLSFGSGAQLKNSVGNWSRWLTDLFGMDPDDNPLKEDQHSSEDSDTKSEYGEPKSFHLLNSLSDLLMLPKDMLMDRSIRMEVCPSISIPLVKRILCNFTPDEFCPDSVPGIVLEAINAESIVERRVSGGTPRGFPYIAAPAVYNPPSSKDVAEKVAEAGDKSQLSRNASIVQRKGYTSDEELEELDCPLTSIVDKLPSSPTIIANGNVKDKTQTHVGINSRYDLLREVWYV